MFHCFAAVGCADLSTPSGGWWRRDGPLSASSGCGQSGHLWQWTCSDEFQWIPDHPVVNCTQAASSGSGSTIVFLALSVTDTMFLTSVWFRRTAYTVARTSL